MVKRCKTVGETVGETVETVDHSVPKLGGGPVEPTARSLGSVDRWDPTKTASEVSDPWPIWWRHQGVKIIKFDKGTGWNHVKLIIVDQLEDLEVEDRVRRVIAVIAGRSTQSWWGVDCGRCSDRSFAEWECLQLRIHDCFPLQARTSDGLNWH